MSGGAAQAVHGGRHRLPVAVLACAGVLFVLVVCGAAARSGSWASGPHHTATSSAGSPAAVDGSSPVPEASSPAAIKRGAGPGLDAVVYLLAAFTLVMFLLGVAFLSDFIRLPGPVRWKRRRGSAQTEAAEDVTDPGEHALQAAVQRGLREMADQPDAREAVVRAWLLLGEAAAVAGTPRRPAESAREYARRLGDTHGLPRTSLERLAALYREARFSDHEMLPEQRAVARNELFALQTALAGGVDLAGFR